jgi:acetylornithine deacetylase
MGHSEKKIMKIDPQEILGRLVSIPSVNPMGGPGLDAEFGEARLTDWLQEQFQQAGLAIERQTVAPGRDNLFARLDGRTPPETGGPLLLFDAHQDTVPVDGMTIEPWTPSLREGRLYGRGACDVKGGMAAMITTLLRLAGERPSSRPTIVMSCTVNEEYGFSGITALVGRIGNPSCLRDGLPTRSAEKPATTGSPLLPRRPDAAIVAEPTSLDVVVAHKGVARWRLHTRGRAAHSSRPQSGENAVYHMARVLLELERYQQELDAGPVHPLCGPASLSVGTIRGGASVNTIPDRATIEIDRRLRPDESLAAVQEHLADNLAGHLGKAFPLEWEAPSMHAPALSDEHNGPLSQRLAAAAREVSGHSERIGAAYATNAAFLAAAGVPTVVFGPGSIEQAHTADEWISLDQVQQAAEILYRFARDVGA